MALLPPRSASLLPFFTPRGVAVIGASRDASKLSYGVIRNLTDPERGYPGPIYPINPRADEILGLRCYPDIASVPDPVELAVLIIPAGAVPAAIEACGQRGLKAAVVISGGFREVGPEGAAREAEMVAIAGSYGLRVMGPNGIGVIDCTTPLNTTFVRGMPPEGRIAFLSQSGAFCGSIIDWTIGQGIGFSKLLSVGNEADVNETDVIPVLAHDDATRVITLYLEDVKGGPEFVDVLRDAAARKPVLALKSGRTRSGQAATASHTGALASTYAAFSAACRQAGAIEAGTVRELFDAALALAYQPPPAGNRIALVTNAGGPAAVAADALEGAGLRLARTSPAAGGALRAVLHPDAQVAGPVDLLGGGSPAEFRRATEIALADPACDAVLAMLVPHVLVDTVAVVEAWRQAAEGQPAPAKPVLVCMMGEASLKAAFLAARAAGLPAYTFPEDAVLAMAALWRRARAERRIADAPPASPPGPPHPAILESRAAGMDALDADAALRVLGRYGIMSPDAAVARTAGEAAELAAVLGFPVALKLLSPDILHKTDVGGVLLNLPDEQAVRAGFETIVGRAGAAHPGATIRGVQVQRMAGPGHEVIIGMKRDPTFGPMVMFGLGGVYAEALADVSFRLAPLSQADAEEMIAEVQSARLLDGLRGAPPADRQALVNAIVAVGELARANPAVAELDINPLLARPDGALALDARIILRRDV
jgi:acetyltransferase